ncbi:MucBP domain-containing protein [Fontibacillus sp. BL9]|uniref:MucBP domain-containing protein n=1 Tax=Fontibacillus sp. BL9 TaxID=3389971 RepID=UPI00397952FE
MKRGLKIVVSWLCLFSLLVGALPVYGAGAGNISWPNPGATNLDKKAKPTGNFGEWEINLTVDGKNRKSTTDVVLVIDRSGSMDGTRMTKAKDAAKSFVNHLLLEGTNPRIALVTFDKGADKDVSDGFKSFTSKSSLITAINGISASNQGTNIQAGLRAAQELLGESSAENKYIVLLSDGEPTYSYEAVDAIDYNWPDNSHQFAITEFGGRVGNGSDYTINYSFKWIRTGIFSGYYKYKVYDHSIATISQAKIAKDTGYKIFSVGLEVPQNGNEEKILKNIQSEGYYSAKTEDLNQIFNAMVGEIAYAAKSAVVTDPMGSMFDLVPGSISVSQGTYTWNEQAETISWDAGNIVEGNTATLTYKVKLDQSKNPVSNVEYPMNGKTTLDYTDIKNNPITKEFPIPKDKIGNGSILIKGYQVNAQGKPVNANGVEVSSPELAQQLYSEKYKDQNGKDSLPLGYGPYLVPAKEVLGNQLKVGESPRSVILTVSNPNPTIWFGYAKAVEQTVTVKYLDKSGKPLLNQTEKKGLPGSKVELNAEKIDGYTVVAPEKVVYTFTSEPNQVHTFYYTANEQNVTVKYLKKGTTDEVAPSTTVKGLTGETIELTAANAPGYTPEKATDNYTIKAEGNNEYIFYYTASEQNVTVKYLKKGTTDEVAPSTTVKGLTGETIELTAANAPGYTPEKATDNYTIKAEGNNEYIFYYTANEQNVTVKYLKKGTTDEVAPSTTVKGLTGETIELTAANAPGYTPEKATDNYTIKAEGNNEYIFYYTASEQNVTVKYLKKGTTDEVAPSTIVKGLTGETIELTAANAPGYTPEKATDNYTIKAEGNNEYIFYYTASEQNVTVKYLKKGTSDEVAPSTTVKGLTGETIELTAANAPGYTPEKATDNYTIKAEGNNEYIFYYTASEQNVTVKYLKKGTTDEVAPSTTVKGLTGETIELTAANAPGYTPEKATDNYTIKAEGNNEYIFYYTASEQNVTVKYLKKGTTDEVAPSTTVKGLTGETIELTAANAPGYTPEKATDNYTIKAEGNNEYIFYYTASEQNVTVKYLKKGTTDEVAPSTIVKGLTGETIELTAANAPGYTPEKATDNYTIKAEGNNEYTFYYTANEQSVVVKHVVEGTNEVLDTETQTGKTGEKLTLEAKEFPGYTVVGEPTREYTLGAENPEQTFYYTANEQSVVVKHVVEGTNEVLDTETQTGKTGEKLTLEAKEFPGYTVVGEPTREYTLGAENPEQTFYYTANEQSVVVKHVVEGTNEVLDTETQTGKTGEKLTLEAKEFPGYTVVGEPTREYTLGAENPEYTFYYTADEQSVEVQYLEEGTDKELSDPTTSNGVTGQTIVLKAKDITGYTPLEPTYSYTLGVENAPHVFYYKANEPDNNRTLTVRYVDLITGNDLLDPTEHAGKVGEEITLTANDYTDSVTGAVYKPHDYSVPYTFKNEPLHDVFTFNYTQDVTGLERTVLVHHVDKESNLPLMEPTLASGKVGETILLKAGPISVADAVYMPEELTYNYTLTLDLEQEFTIYYNLGEPSGDVVQLTISYLDRETNGEIASQEVIEGKAGTQFTLNAKNVPGYTPEIPSYDYHYSDEPNQNYVFYYTKNAPADQQLTVKYLLNGTNEQLASPSVFTGKPGETKTLTAVSISGYTPVKSTDAYTFTTQAGQEYIFYYTRNSSNPGGSGGSNTSSGSTVTPLPALPPLPAVPPTLEMENHYDYINGYPDGSVKPLNNITREEVAAIFYRLLDDESRSEYLKTGNSFSDVGATRWSNKHISTMENAGVITGYPDGTFKPGQYITRAEFAAIASRFDKLDERVNDSFTDITGHWAEKYIASAANKGWIKGYTDGTFKPNQYITRAEAAAFINSVLNRKVDKDGIHEDAKMWPDNVYGKWYYYDILEATNHHDYSREEESEVEVWEEVLPNRVYP